MKSIVFDNQRDLFFAVLKEDYPTIRKLVSGGQSINTCRPSDGFTPLFIAVSHNNVDMLKFLLSIGADPTLKSKSNNTALDLALSSLNFSPTLVENLLSGDKNSGIKFDYYKLATTQKYDAATVSIVRKRLDASYTPSKSDYFQFYSINEAEESLAFEGPDNYDERDLSHSDITTELIGITS